LRWSLYFSERAAFSRKCVMPKVVAFDMKGITLAVAFAVLSAICGAHADDTKGPTPEVKQDGALENRPDTLPPDLTRDKGTTATGHHEDHNITRPRTREDVIRDIFRDQPSGAPGRPGKPQPSDGGG